MKGVKALSLCRWKVHKIFPLNSSRLSVDMALAGSVGFSPSHNDVPLDFSKQIVSVCFSSPSICFIFPLHIVVSEMERLG